LALGRVADFNAAVEATWRDFAFAYPNGESNAAAQSRVSAAVTRIAAAHPGRVAIASHGNAIALFLRTLDPAVDFAFWSRMSMPDIYEVTWPPGASPALRRVWSEGDC
jgi:2,3-bisphosphoglycerate-dependent phosphoglycerate mutase